MNFWNKIANELKDGHSVAFMYVHNSEGSSPGRQGFKMFVSNSRMLGGSIGGGPMEHKLVELCRSKLSKGSFKPFTLRQIHKSNIAKDKSGMNCSGEQTVGFYFLSESSLDLVKKLIAHAKNDILRLSNSGITLEKGDSLDLNNAILVDVQGENWEVREQLSAAPELHIIGGGHVSEAVTSLGLQLGFSVHIYETRDDLNTLSKDDRCTFTFISDYSQIGGKLKSGLNKYVVLMSFGFRTDKVALTALLDKEFKYLGMMGSKEKIKTLLAEMIDEGADKSRLEKVYAPIGVQISSKTPMEIAVSIMAEVIGVKNKS